MKSTRLCGAKLSAAALLVVTEVKAPHWIGRPTWWGGREGESQAERERERERERPCIPAGSGLGSRGYNRASRDLRSSALRERGREKERQSGGEEEDREIGRHKETATERESKIERERASGRARHTDTQTHRHSHTDTQSTDLRNSAASPDPSQRRTCNRPTSLSDHRDRKRRAHGASPTQRGRQRQRAHQRQTQRHTQRERGRSITFSSK